MKTTTIELTPDALAAFVNLVDLGVKAGGIGMVKPAALVLPLLEAAQLDLNRQGNGEDVVSSPSPEPDNQDAIGGTDG